MLIRHDPDEWVTEANHRTCAFHQQHPGQPFAGCTCSGTIGRRRATPEERAARRRERLEKRRAELREELAQIDAELSTPDPGETP